MLRTILAVLTVITLSSCSSSVDTDTDKQGFCDFPESVSYTMSFNAPSPSLGDGISKWTFTRVSTNIYELSYFENNNGAVGAYREFQIGIVPCDSALTLGTGSEFTLKLDAGSNADEIRGTYRRRDPNDQLYRTFVGKRVN